MDNTQITTVPPVHHAPLTTPHSPLPPHLSADAVIDVQDVTVRFGSFTAVDRASFQVAPGEVFGLLGPNGSGKTTLIRALCGLIPLAEGAAQVLGRNVAREAEKVRAQIGYMSQKFSLYEDLTPAENIRFYLGIYSVPEKDWDERTEWALSMARLKEMRDRLTRELPTGWRQRLALACALLHRPEILFLDEPTSGVDPITRRHFWEFIRSLAAKGVTVFVTTHYMDEALNCDRIVMINDGKIVAIGSPGEIIAKTCPGEPKATLNDAFIRLMTRPAEERKE